MPQTDVKTQVEELSVESFETFCEDIAGMFGIDMDCTAQGPVAETSKGLAKKYKKLAALFTVQSTGILDGDFHLVVDKEGLFTLSGTIVMLPEKRILDMRKKGTQQDAEELDDAVGETGNLLVGSWDRVFREGWSEHGHFLQTGTFIGVPWSDSQENIGIAEDEEFMYIPLEMTVGEFPAFQCGVIFPESLFTEKTASDVEDEATEAESVNENEEVSEEITETPAEAAAETEEVSEPESQPEETAELPQDDQQPEQAELEEVASETQSADVAEETQDSATVPVSLETEDTDPGREQANGVVSQSIENMVHSFPSLPGEEMKSFLTLQAQSVMQKKVVWISSGDSVQQAMTTMQENDAGYLMVGENGVLEGIISWVDLIGAISVYLKPVFAKWRRPADDATLQIRLKVIMTRPVRTARPETSLAVIMENMCQHGLRCLPILDDGGAVIGQVTAFDIFKAMLNTDSEFATVGQSPQGTLLQPQDSE